MDTKYYYPTPMLPWVFCDVAGGLIDNRNKCTSVKGFSLYTARNDKRAETITELWFNTIDGYKNVPFQSYNLGVHGIAVMPLHRIVIDGNNYTALAISRQHSRLILINQNPDGQNLFIKASDSPFAV